MNSTNSNSTIKTVWIVIGAVVIILIIFSLVGRNAPLGTGGDDNAETSVQADRSTGEVQKTASNNSSANPKNQIVPPPSQISDAALATIISNSLVRVPQTGVDVALSAGSASYSDGSVKGQVSIVKVLGRVSTESGFDVFVELNVTKTGTPSISNYVAMFHNIGSGVTYTSAHFVGDRITITGMTASVDNSVSTNQPTTFMNSATGYNLTISYLDRKNGEPFTTAPSLPKSVTVHVKGHTFKS